MTHISRPLQIALVAMVLFLAVWFLALRGHSAGSEGAGSSASSSAGQAAPAAKTAAPAKAAGSGGSSSPGSVYHGSAPGVEGLTRAITKARGAVAQSEQNAKQQQQKSAQASSAAPAQAAGKAATGSQAKSSAGSKAAATAAPSTAGQAPSPAKAASGAPAKQALVEKELKQNRTVILLFWSPKGTDDVAVRGQLQRLQVFHKASGLTRNKNIAVHEARANEVAEFGTITRSLQVSQTPTMLIITPSGNTKTLTGLTDAYAIQQAISEARHS